MEKTPGQMVAIGKFSQTFKIGLILVIQTFQEDRRGKNTFQLLWYGNQTSQEKKIRQISICKPYKETAGLLEACYSTPLGWRVREEWGIWKMLKLLEASPSSSSVKMLCKKRLENIRSGKVRSFKARWTYDCKIKDKWELRPQATLACMS